MDAVIQVVLEMSVECAKCGEVVETGTQKCPNCEYRPQKSMQVVGAVGIVAGFIISATIIGAIIGIPIAMFGVYRLFKGGNLTVESDYGV